MSARLSLWAWRLWWLAGLAVPFAQLRSASVEDSGWIVFTVWAIFAGWLALWTPIRRRVSTGWVAWVMAAWLVHPLLVSWPSLAKSDWVDAWGVVAHFSASGCLAAALAWGTASVIRHSPRVGLSVPIVLCVLLASNLWAQHAQTTSTWSRWVFNEMADLGGFFSSRTVSSAWCAIALPIGLAQRGWRKGLAVPAVIGALQSHRTTVFVALTAWLVWRVWPWVRRYPVRVSAALSGVILVWVWHVEGLDAVVAGVLPRLSTWPAVLQAIWQHPLGIGWNPMAYHDLIRSAPHAIMGHPSSSLLAWTLSGGWALGASVVWMTAWTWQRIRRDDGLSGALVVCTVLMLIQRTIAQAQVGALAWAVWCLWLIQRTEELDASRMA